MSIIFFVMFFPLFVILSYGMVKLFKEMMDEKDDLLGQMLLLGLFWSGWAMTGIVCIISIVDFFGVKHP